MFKNLIQSFLPWILYFILVGPTQERLDLAIIVAAFTSIAFELRNLKRGYVLSWGTLVFFLFLLISVVALRIDIIAKYEWILSNGTLALITFGSILIKKPFTIQYAKEEVAPEYWHTPLFIRINYILTAFWGLCFLIGLALNVIHVMVPSFSGRLYEMSTYVPSIIGVLFTAKFPEWYKARYLKK